MQDSLRAWSLAQLTTGSCQPPYKSISSCVTHRLLIPRTITAITGNLTLLSGLRIHLCSAFSHSAQFLCLRSSRPPSAAHWPPLQLCKPPTKASSTSLPRRPPQPIGLLSKLGSSLRSPCWPWATLLCLLYSTFYLVFAGRTGIQGSGSAPLNSLL